jgi:mono/diheme cytochrome c family protein
MTLTRAWSVGGAVAVGLAALAVTACGSQSPGDSSTPSSGAEVFASAGCGGCHTLAAAHANGNVGPNLDELKPSVATVARQVRAGGGGMPSFAGELSPAQIQAVAQYVVRVTHHPGATR